MYKVHTQTRYVGLQSLTCYTESVFDVRKPKFIIIVNVFVDDVFLSIRMIISGIIAFNGLSMFVKAVGSWGFFSPASLLVSAGPERTPECFCQHTQKERPDNKLFLVNQNETCLLYAWVFYDCSKR